MTMTLRELRAWHEDKYNTKFLSREDYQVHFDAIALIDAHLSQPQPVAQGEAEGLQPHKWERKYAGTGRTVWECSECFRYGGFAERPCSEPSKHPGCNADALQATPTIPTGHRVVPIEFGDDFIDAMCEVVCVEAGESFSKLDNFTKGCLRDTQRKALLAAITVAAPDAGGV